jgi:pyridoxamine 5'-phosphate oxidase
MSSVADIRKEYRMKTLMENEVDADPIVQFGKWWNEVLQCDIAEPNAMTLATASAAAVPSARIVLLKEYNEKGFVFFTNYKSRKGTELLQNTNACLVFFWKELERQVRIDGIAEKISAEESDAYFASRPHESQVGAWASEQSSILSNRKELDEKAALLTLQYQNSSVPRPDWWGGYIVKPHTIEFWQGRPGRMHDRILYDLQEERGWKIERLSP